MGEGHVSCEQLLQQTRHILEAWGMPRDLVDITAELLNHADRVGVDSHGISMLPMYETKLREGTLNIAAIPKIVKQTDAMALIDGDAGLGHPAGALGMRTAIDLAARSGVGVAVVFNSHHFGAAGSYARLALEHGMISLVLSSANNPILVPTGARQPALGTNPLAFAAPAANNDSFELDMATTTVAANKIKVYDYDKKPLPAGWVVNADGESVTDSAQGMEWIFQQPLGGLTPVGGTSDMSSHKGYGLAMMAQILSSTLSGAEFCGRFQSERKPGMPDNVGHFMLVLDPGVFRPLEDFENDLSDMLGYMRDLEHVTQGETVKVAGDPEKVIGAERAVSGVPLSHALKLQLQALCERWQIEYIL